MTLPRLVATDLDGTLVPGSTYAVETVAGIALEPIFLEAAHQVAPSNDEDGVAQVREKLLA